MLKSQALRSCPIDGASRKRSQEVGKLPAVGCGKRVNRPLLTSDARVHGSGSMATPFAIDHSRLVPQRRKHRSCGRAKQPAGRMIGGARCRPAARSSIKRRVDDTRAPAETPGCAVRTPLPHPIGEAAARTCMAVPPIRIRPSAGRSTSSREFVYRGAAMTMGLRVFGKYR